MSLWFGDCLDLLRLLPSNSIDMILTSPPYDRMRNYTPLPFEKFLVIAKELLRVLKPGGTVVWIVGDQTEVTESCTSLLQALYFRQIGFCLHDTMIFEKNSATHPSRIGRENRYTQLFEYIFIFSKGGPPKTANLLCDRLNAYAGQANWAAKTDRGRGDELHITNKFTVNDFSPRGNIFRYAVGGNQNTRHKKAYEHPATFPESLAIDQILTWSEEDDCVLDIFAGSGTVGVACKRFKRKFLGCEIDLKYCQIAQERIASTIYRGESFSSWEAENKRQSIYRELGSITKRLPWLLSNIHSDQLVKAVSNFVKRLFEGSLESSLAEIEFASAESGERDEENE